MTHCECGTLRAGRAEARCQECGTPCCPTCAVPVEATVYCRWCGTRTAPAATA